MLLEGLQALGRGLPARPPGLLQGMLGVLSSAPLEEEGALRVLSRVSACRGLEPMLQLIANAAPPGSLNHVSPHCLSG